MAVRESINVVQQVGVQTALGTAAAATKRFAGTNFNIGDRLETKKSRRKGAKFDTTSVINKAWAEGTFDGVGSYVELCYILAGLMPFTVAPVAGASGAHEWLFTPNSAGNDDGKFLTIEEGDDEAAEQYPDVAITNIDLNFNRDDVTFNGNCFARPLDAAFNTLSSGVSALAERPISGSEVDVFMDDTFAALGTTKLTDAFEARFSMGAKREPKWVLNTSFKSWKEAKEIASDGTLAITTEHNSQSRAIRAGLLANAPKFFRILATGPEIVAGANYIFQLDYCGKINNPNRQPDFQGIYGFEYEYGAFQENTMNRGYKIRIVNGLAAL